MEILLAIGVGVLLSGTGAWFFLRQQVNTGFDRGKAELEAERAMLTEKLGVLNQAQEQLAGAFRALSAQALHANNNKTFLELAAQTLGRFQRGAQGDLEKRQQAIQELVVPVKQSLEKLDGRIQEIEKVREGAYQALTTQVRLPKDRATCGEKLRTCCVPCASRSLAAGGVSFNCTAWSKSLACSRTATSSSR